MAMIITDMVNAMVQALVDAEKLEGMSPTDIANLKADMVITENAKWIYTKANMGIKGVQISTGTTLLNSPTPLVPVPTDGGAVVSTQMVANSANNTLSQNNDGTGLIE